MKPGSRRAAVVVLIAAAAVATSSSLAYAQQPKNPKETARLLFEEGKSRRDRGDKAGALEAFTTADGIMKVPTTKLAVARALAALDRLIEARDAANAVGLIPVAAKESQPFVDARQAAVELVKDLDARIPSLTIVLQGARLGDVPTVTLDGEPIASEKLSAPMRLNPGKHVIASTLDGHVTTADVTLAERASESVTLVVREPDKTATLVAPPPKEGSRGRSPLVYVGLGVAVVGVGLGAVAGIISTGKTSDVEAMCRDGKCPPPAHETLDSANTWATISTVSFIGAGVGLALAGVGLVVLAPKPSSTATAEAAHTKKIQFVMTSSGLGGVF